MKNFFNSLFGSIRSRLNTLEEKYLFVYGKRAWQVLSLISISGLVVALCIYGYNSLPTSREEVSISKIEFQKNQIDDDFDPSNDVESCTDAEYKKQFDLLRKAMPKAEWKNLGDSVETTEYDYIEKYDYYYGTYYDRVPYKVKQYRKNDDAIPNILESVFDSRGVDSFQMCERINTLKLIGALNAYVKPDASTTFLKSPFKTVLTYNHGLKTKNIKDVAKIFKKIEGHQPKFIDPYSGEDDWDQYSNYLSQFDNDTITDERIEFIIKTLGSINQKKKLKEAPTKHAISMKILASNLEDEDLFIACDGYFGANEFIYSEENVLSNFNKYMGLFKKKVKLAEKLLAEEEAEKEENRDYYKYFSLISFASILSIATILLLFSIRNILNKRD